jgi:hypothetical protein
MKQYGISLALLIAIPVALPKSTNAQSQAEMHHQAAKDFHKADAELNSTYAALVAKLQPRLPRLKIARPLLSIRNLLRRQLTFQLGYVLLGILIALLSGGKPARSSWTNRSMTSRRGD